MTSVELNSFRDDNSYPNLEVEVLCGRRAYPTEATVPTYWGGLAIVKRMGEVTDDENSCISELTEYARIVVSSN